MTIDASKRASLRRITRTGHHAINAAIAASCRFDHDQARIENAAMLEEYLRSGFVCEGCEDRANRTIDTLLVQAGRRSA